MFGAAKVVCYDLRLRESKSYRRESLASTDPLLLEGPALGAHTDITARSGPEMIKNRLGTDVFEAYRTPEYRFRIVNTWRSRNAVCEHNPLAVCDYRTVDPEVDLIACDRVIPERAGEVYYIHHSERQQWATMLIVQCFLKNQTVDEIAVMLMYDSEPGKQAKYCPHISFKHLEARPDAPTRRSVETRSIVITKR
ncbi:hypothetical protein B0T24DRAFT_710323 [Lasiosphaeria ovina]|uniref:Uncharacterized protein n=1 Tax=Lasiosphaeria ovina TaxID=92902 RepID=A0AAE0N1L3_9PEZI|nr:hypothetical protein B0T24DRAFT_710323 [Lasiosphaeria ovina]